VLPAVNKTVFVTELSDRDDEGMRNWLKTANRALTSRGHRAEILRIDGNPRWSVLRPRTLQGVRQANAHVLVYVPYSGLTSKALLRHAVLRTAAAAHLDVFVTLQSDGAIRRLPRHFAPAVGAYASERLRSAHRDITRNSTVLPPVVDSTRFRPSGCPRPKIREQLGLPSDKPMMLHIGHLRRSRGLEPLAELAAQGLVSVVVVASTSTEVEADVQAHLRETGVIVRREFVCDIERWYQAADVYVFPVSDLQGSVEIPLTVLEAMACGVPVATAPFGGLPSVLASTGTLRFAPPPQLAKVAVGMIGIDGIPNRTAVSDMTESALADELERIVAPGKS
jgi:glycosyltransferase involved in cell wall biosynthesis